MEDNATLNTNASNRPENEYPVCMHLLNVVEFLEYPDLDDHDDIDDTVTPRRYSATIASSRCDLSGYHYP